MRLLGWPPSASGREGAEMLHHCVAVDPPVAMVSRVGNSALHVLLQVGEDRLETRDLLLEASQRRLFAGHRIVVDQARVAERVDRRVAGTAMDN